MRNKTIIVRSHSDTPVSSQDTSNLLQSHVEANILGKWDMGMLILIDAVNRIKSFHLVYEELGAFSTVYVSVLLIF